MKKPQNYAELRQRARDEVQAKMDELLERADNLKAFLARMDDVTDWDSLQALLKDTDVSYYGDDVDLEAIYEIADNWPDVSEEPGTGGGYWDDRSHAP